MSTPSDQDIKRRLHELLTKEQRAGLSSEEKLERIALLDQQKAHPRIDKEAVAQRISGREAGERVRQVVDAVLQGIKDQPRAIESFFRALAEPYQQHILFQGDMVSMRESRPMTPAEAQGWAEATRMTFGRYAGVLISDTPLKYLLWLDSSDDEFRLQLRRYLASGLRTGGDDE